VAGITASHAGEGGSSSKEQIVRELIDWTCAKRINKRPRKRGGSAQYFPLSQVEKLVQWVASHDICCVCECTFFQSGWRSNGMLYQNSASRGAYATTYHLQRMIDALTVEGCELHVPPRKVKSTSEERHNYWFSETYMSCQETSAGCSCQ
jgi:hypothetical protein